MTDAENTGGEKARSIDVANFDLDEFRNSFIQRRRKSIKNKLKKRLRFISVIFFIAMAGASFFALRTALYYIESVRDRSIQEKAADIAGRQALVNVQPQEAVRPQENDEPLDVPAPEATLAPKEFSEDEETPEKKEILKKIAELRREFSNDDIVGFLTIEGTEINYAVVQSDDNEFYLNHDLYGSKSVSGSIFMDYENSAGLFDDNTIIYGHNMADGSMFHNLRYYADKKYFDSHPFVYLTTPYEETVWEVFAVYKTNVDFNYIQTSFEDRAQFSSFIAQMTEKSIHDAGVRVEATDKILTLSTCSGQSGNNRFVLNAKLLTD